MRCAVASPLRAPMRASVEFVGADLLSDEGWAEAMQGCAFVQHVASPFPLKEPRDPEDVIRPAREGRLARAAGGRAAPASSAWCMTSSIVAIDLPWPEAPLGHVFTEADWTNPERPDVTTYVVSKTLAERAAWDFVKSGTWRAGACRRQPGFRARAGARCRPLDLARGHPADGGQGPIRRRPRSGFPSATCATWRSRHALAMVQPEGGGRALPLRQRLPAADRDRAPGRRRAARSQAQGAEVRDARFRRARALLCRPSPQGGAARSRPPAARSPTPRRTSCWGRPSARRRRRCKSAAASLRALHVI